MKQFSILTQLPSYIPFIETEKKLLAEKEQFISQLKKEGWRIIKVWYSIGEGLETLNIPDTDVWLVHPDVSEDEFLDTAYNREVPEEGSPLQKYFPKKALFLYETVY